MVLETAKIPLEHQILLACAAFDHGRAYRLSSEMKGDEGWRDLLLTADQHRMMPLLFWTLGTTPSTFVPAAVAEELRARFKSNALRNLSLMQELQNLLTRFELSNIRVFPYKGPTLALAVYGNLALRDIDDLDLLVHEGDVIKAKSELIASGYWPEVPLSAHQEAAYLRRGCVCVFLSNSSQVELHWKNSKHLSPAIEFDSAWEQRETVEIEGVQFATLCPEHLLPLLCVHGGKHCWNKLMLIADVAQLLKKYPDLDWTRCLAQAKKQSVERATLLGLRLAQNLLGATLPADVDDRLHRDAAVARLAAKMQAKLWQEKKPGGSDVGRFSLLLGVRDSWTDAVSYATKFLLTPTVQDCAAVDLPGLTSIGYPFVRVLRLCGKKVLARRGRREC